MTDCTRNCPTTCLAEKMLMRDRIEELEKKFQILQIDYKHLSEGFHSALEDAKESRAQAKALRAVE